jgi:crotonobetainyl-CoA:carnitine CoA-transferase CaiB-like acyl-CoA transferase
MMIDEARYWSQACKALGLDDIVDSYPDAVTGQPAKDAVHARIAAVIAAETREQVEARLTSQGCIYSFFATPAEVLDDEAARDNGYLMQHPRDDVRIPAAPVQFDDEQLTVRRAGPRLGEHTSEVLSEIGYTAEQIADLLSNKVVSTEAG